MKNRSMSPSQNQFFYWLNNRQEKSKLLVSFLKLLNRDNEKKTIIRKTRQFINEKVQYEDSSRIDFLFSISREVLDTNHGAQFNP